MSLKLSFKFFALTLRGFSVSCRLVFWRWFISKEHYREANLKINKHLIHSTVSQRWNRLELNNATGEVTRREGDGANPDPLCEHDVHSRRIEFLGSQFDKSKYSDCRQVSYELNDACSDYGKLHFCRLRACLQIQKERKTTKKRLSATLTWVSIYYLNLTHSYKLVLNGTIVIRVNLFLCAHNETSNNLVQARREADNCLIIGYWC